MLEFIQALRTPEFGFLRIALLSGLLASVAALAIAAGGSAAAGDKADDVVDAEFKEVKRD